MSSRAVSIVKGWMQEMCPTFPSLTPSKPRFIVHRHLGSEFPTERLFLTSAFANWGDASYYDSLMESSTTSGRDLFSSLSTAASEGCSVVGDRAIIGPTRLAGSVVVNSAIGAGTLRSRIVGMFPTKPEYARLIAYEVVGKTIEQIAVMQGVVDCVSWLTAAGLTFGQPTRLSVSGVVYPNVEYLKILLPALHGPGKVFAYVISQDVVDTGDGIVTYWVSPRPDDSVALINMAELGFTGGAETWISDYLLSPASQFLAEPVSDHPPITYPDWLSERANLQSQILSQVMDQAFDGIGSIDESWLKCVAIPRTQEYFVSTAVSQISVLTEDEGDYEVVTITTNGGETLGAVPVDWYIEYANLEIAAGASNSEALRKSVDGLSEFQGQTVTYVEFEEPIFLPKDIVELTSLHRDYKKIREKACEEDDFLSLEFATGITYGSVQTKINGSRLTPVMYGYRDSGTVSVVDVSMSTSGRGLTLTLGGSVVNSRRSDGTFAPSYTASLVSEFLHAVNTGAKLEGGTVTDQMAIWQLDSSMADVASEGMASTASRVASSDQYGTAAALYDFQWGSVGVSGYPLYRDVNPQTSYRMAMLSKTVLSVAGPAFRKIHANAISTTSIAKKYPTIT